MSIQQSTCGHSVPFLIPYTPVFGWRQLHFPPSAAAKFGTGTSEKPSANTSNNNALPNLIRFIRSSLLKPKLGARPKAWTNARTKKGANYFLHADSVRMFCFVRRVLSCALSFGCQLKTSRYYRLILLSIGLFCYRGFAIQAPLPLKV